MYVIDVIPFSRSAPAGSLTYRSREELSPGTLVDITLRKTKLQGMVVACTRVEEAKAMLKRADFVPSTSAPSKAGILPEALLKAAYVVADYHAVTLGSVLAAVFGEQARSGATLSFGSELSTDAVYGLQALEMPIAQRADEYQKHIDDAQALGTAALLVVPTIAEVEYWKEVFKRYSPLVLSGAVAGARRVRALEAARDHTGLIISTPAFSWTPITKLGLLIVERVSAGTYTLPKRPYLHMDRALKELAQANSIPFVVGDYPLPLAYRAQPEAAPTIPLTIPFILHDARRPEDDQVKEHKPFKAIPTEIQAEIKVQLENRGRVVVLASRRGYAPAVVCRECGQTVTDDRGMQLSFTMSGGKRIMRSSDGKTIIDAKRICDRCGSWNLLPLGIGVERVQEELLHSFPNVPITILDTEALRSPSAAKKALKGIEEPGTIVIGTEAMLPWLLRMGKNAPLFSLGIIASSDSLLALPFWKSRERFVRLAYFFSGLVERAIVVTRHPEDAAVNAITTPTTAAIDHEATNFFAEETMLRRALAYPPFGTLIVLHLEGSVASLDDQSTQLHSLLAPYTFTQLPDRAISKTILRRTFVYMVLEDAWPNADFARKLQQLSPAVALHIDPESF